MDKTCGGGTTISDALRSIEEEIAQLPPEEQDAVRRAIHEKATGEKHRPEDKDLPVKK